MGPRGMIKYATAENIERFTYDEDILPTLKSKVFKVQRQPVDSYVKEEPQSLTPAGTSISDPIPAEEVLDMLATEICDRTFKEKVAVLRNVEMDADESVFPISTIGNFIVPLRLGELTQSYLRIVVTDVDPNRISDDQFENDDAGDDDDDDDDASDEKDDDEEKEGDDEGDDHGDDDG